MNTAFAYFKNKVYKKNNTTSRMIAFLSVLLIISCLSFSQTAPGWSRGQQILKITYDGCLNRANDALINEGYHLDYDQGSFRVGIKGVHTAVIMCNPAPEGITVNIVVASNGDGGGDERVHLQAQMENPHIVIPVSTSFPGNWVYYDISSGYSIKQHFDADGNGKAEDGRPCTWKTEGNELVLTWNNGWVNHYTLPISNKLTGTAFGPSGEKHDITLTRQ